jgi:hypothetical protein
MISASVYSWQSLKLIRAAPAHRTDSSSEASDMAKCCSANSEHAIIIAAPLVQAGLRGTAGRFVGDCFAAVCELAREDEPVRDSLRNRARLERRAEARMREHLTEPV